jgi:hypothetical protein
MNNKNNIKPKLNPNFSHRSIPGDKDVTPLSLSSAVNLLALQGKAILEILSLQFADPENTVSSPDIIFWALESAINTLNDIDEVVKAYHDAHKDSDAEVIA